VISKTRRPHPAVAAKPASRLGGTLGNERLTASLGGLLFVLLAVLGLTIPSVHSLLYEHVYLGMLLIPPVLLKMGSTGYRFVRYYTGHRAYREGGPPAPLLRMIAPLVVLSTVAVFGSGVMLLVLGPGAGLMRGLHQASFILWFGVTTIHVLAYVQRVPALVGADWRGTDRRVGGSLERRLLVAASVAAGIVLASLTVRYAQPWASAFRFH